MGNVLEHLMIYGHNLELLKVYFYVLIVHGYLQHDFHSIHFKIESQLYTVLLERFAYYPILLYSLL